MNGDSSSPRKVYDGPVSRRRLIEHVEHAQHLTALGRAHVPGAHGDRPHLAVGEPAPQFPVLVVLVLTEEERGRHRPAPQAPVLVEEPGDGPDDRDSVLSHDAGIGTVTLSGAALATHTRIIAQFFEALAQGQIPVDFVSVADTRITAVTPRHRAAAAAQALALAFGLGRDGVNSPARHARHRLTEA